MSGLLRRIKRSRTADAGEAPAAGQAAGPEGAPTTAQTPAGGDPGSARAIEPRAPAPAIHADPNVPAGLEPAAAAPVTGRRSRLRRRLRYLRRARELMLRDLGGMLYEVHRSGGGDVAAHAGVIDGKVERLAGLDAEAASIAAALAAPRSEEVVFQPGVGGTCDFCGELYGSAARFCSNCGSPTGSAVRATAAMTEPRPVPPMPKPPAPREAQPTRVLAPEPPAAPEPAEQPTAETAAPEGAAEPEQPTAAPDAAAEPEQPTAAPDAAAEPEQPAAEPAPEGETRNPFSGLSNGRPEETAPPELSSGDPLASREPRP